MKSARRMRWCTLAVGVALLTLSACSLLPTDRGQQYRDGKLEPPFSLENPPDTSGIAVNPWGFSLQANAVEQYAPGLYGRQSALYQQINQWLQAGGDTRLLQDFGVNAWQMRGADGYGNVLFTGYYTPVLEARRQRQGAFQYPLYRMPSGKAAKASRRQIHAGAISGKYVLAYSNSLMDNFIMGVQGSGYVDFGDGQPPEFFSYGGKNGQPYRSIGKVLIDRGEIERAAMSMQAIRHWGETHSEREVRALLEENPSYVFFKPQGNAPVKGASGVPLIDKAAVAADPALVPAGSVLLAEVPLLDDQGQFSGHYQLRVVIALDVGGAIKGQHFDIYQGIGDQAGHQAGWLSHYGRVWLLNLAQDPPGSTADAVPGSTAGAVPAS